MMTDTILQTAGLPDGVSVDAPLSAPVHARPDLSHLPECLDREGAVYTLRPYQIEGAVFLAEHKRAVLADAPGLGKTLQAATAARPYGQTLIVCPTYLIEQWADVLREQWPDDEIAVASGPPLRRIKALDKTPNAKWYIMNTEALRTYYPPDVQTVIFDEMHYLRNREAEMSKNAVKLAYRSTVERVYGLTATPVYKDTSNLYHLLHILDKDRWKAYWDFVDMFCNVIHTGFGERVVSTKNRKLLEWWCDKYMFGRTYADVEMQLPDLIEKPVLLEETAEFYKRYNRLRDNYIIDDIPLESAAAVLHELRRMTVTTEKIKAIKSLVDDVPEDKPVLIFCWYNSTAEALGKVFGVEPLTGAVAPNERAAKALSTRVRVAGLAALSEGVDLSDARTIIIVEYDYTPGRMYQAISRVRRYSEDHSPIVLYSVRTKKTVDQIVYDAVQARVGSAHRILREALEQ